MSSDAAYDVFLSYRWEGEDERWAAWLETGLADYRPPRAVRRRLQSWRPLRVFRDRSRLGAAPSLPERLTQALDASSKLVVVCSPRAAASPWIAREIEHVLAHRGRDAVLTVLIDGTPASAFPAPLGARGPQGADEPLAADGRPRAGVSLGERRRDVLLRLAAPLLGVEFDELRALDQERRVRRLRVWLVALTILAGVILGLAAWALAMRDSAERRRVEAEEARRETTVAFAESLVMQAQRLEGEPAERLLLAARAADLHDSAQARGPLLQGAQEAPRLAWVLPRGLRPVRRLALDPQGRWLAAVTHVAELVVWRLKDGQLLARRALPLRSVDGLAFDPVAAVIWLRTPEGPWWRVSALTAERLPDQGAPPAALESCACFPPKREDGVRALGQGVRLECDSSGGWRLVSEGGEACASGRFEHGDPSVAAVAGREGPIAGCFGGALVTVIETQTGGVLRRLSLERKHDEWIRSIALAPDGSWGASVEDGGRILLWDPATGAVRAELQTARTEGFPALAASTDGRFLVAAGASGGASVFDVREARRTGDLKGPGGEPPCLAADPGGARVLLVGADGAVAWLDPAQGTLGAPWKREGARVRCAAVAPGGAAVALGLHTGDVELWTSDGETRRATWRSLDGAVRAMAFTPDGRRLLLGGESLALRAIDPSDGRLLAERATDGLGVLALDVSRDGAVVAVSGSDGALRTFRVADLGGRTVVDRHGAGVSAVRFVGAQRRLVAAGESNGVRCVDLPAASEEVGPPHEAAILCLAVDSEETQVFAGSQKGSIARWSLRDAGAPRFLRGHTAFVTSMALSADALTLLSASMDGTLRRWDLTTEQSTEQSTVLLEDRVAAPTTVAYHPSGTWYVVGDRSTRVRAFLSDGAALPEVLPAGEGSATCMGFNADGSWLAVGSTRKTVNMFSVSGQTTRHAHSLAGHGRELVAVAWHPDGVRLVSAGIDMQIRLWDAARNTLLGTFDGHQGVVGTLGFTADGRFLVSGAMDGTHRIWDVATRRPLATLRGHRGIPGPVRVLPRSGDLLTSGITDSTVRRWTLGPLLWPSGTCLAQAEALTGLRLRGLTVERDIGQGLTLER